MRKQGMEGGGHLPEVSLLGNGYSGTFTKLSFVVVD
jgi:hypothetical protein